MPKKTILFLDQYSNLSGGQKVLLNIIQAFSKKGYRCILVLPQQGLFSERIAALGIRTIFFPIGYYSITQKNIFDFLNYLVRLPILIFLLIKLVRGEDIDIIYANGARTFIWATLACSITRTPLVWHIHSIFNKGVTRKICLLFGKFSVVKRIFAVSRAAADPLNALSPKMETIYNAVGEIPLLKDKDVLRKEYNLDRDAFLVGSVGILEEWKNQEDIIRAAKRIKKSGRKEIYFFIIGDSLYAKHERQKYKYKLKRMVEDAHLEKEVFFTGFRNDIAELMDSLGTLVICSRDPDPCPMVSLEAASLGLPIISTDSGGVMEIFKEDKEALFYKAGDFEDLSNKLIYLFENRQAAQTIGQNARVKVKREHNFDVFLKKITDTIEKTLYEG